MPDPDSTAFTPQDTALEQKQAKADLPPSPPSAPLSDAKVNKLRAHLKDYIRKTDLLVGILNKAHELGFEGKAISGKTTFTEVEGQANNFSKWIDDLVARCDWHESMYQSLRTGLLAQEKHGNLADPTYSLAPILPSHQTLKEGLPKDRDIFRTVIEVLNVRNDGLMLPIVDLTATSNQDSDKLRKENEQLLDQVIQLQSRLDDSGQQQAFLATVKEHEVDKVRWKKDQLQWRKKLADQEAELNDAKAALRRLKEEQASAKRQQEEDLEEESSHVSPITLDSDTSKATIRMLMKQQSQLEARLQKLMEIDGNKDEEIASLKLQLIKAPRKDAASEPVESASRSAPSLVSDGAENPASKEDSHLAGKHTYLKAVIRQYLSYQNAGQQDKAQLVVPALQALLDIE